MLFSLHTLVEPESETVGVQKLHLQLSPKAQVTINDKHIPLCGLYCWWLCAASYEEYDIHAYSDML